MLLVSNLFPIGLQKNASGRELVEDVEWYNLIARCYAHTVRGFCKIVRHYIDRELQDGQK